MQNCSQKASDYLKIAAKSKWFWEVGKMDSVVGIWPPPGRWVQGMLPRNILKISASNA